jgi:transposase
MAMMPGNDVLPEPMARRIEVFTGVERQRRWSSEAKARVVAESYSTSVGEAADRYGLSKTQLFTWRRDARGRQLAPGEPLFAPVMVALPVEPTAQRSAQPARRRSRRGGDGGIELEIDGVVVRIGRGAEVRAVAAIIRALKAAR